MEEIKLSDKSYMVPKLYVYFIFGIYPLIYHNFYYDIVTSKYIVFLAATGLLLIYVFFLIPDKLFTKIKTGEIKLNITDYFVLGFVFVNVISCLFSENRIYTVNGAQGRNVGMVTILMLGVVYFTISRTFLCDSMFYKVMALSSTIISVLGILNSFDIDFMGFYKGLKYSQRVNYLSTIGHIDVYTNYFAISIPVLFMIYLSVNEIKKSLIYLVILVINMLGAMAGHCDSSYIIMVSGMLTAIFLTNKVNLLKAFIPVYLWIIFGFCFVRINSIINEPRIITSVGRILFTGKVILVFTILFCVLVLWNYKKSIDIEKYKKPLILIIAVIAGIYLLSLLIFTFILKNTNLGIFENILRIKDSTGSYRGYIWRIVLTEYGKLDFFHKLFGIGTDALLPFLEKIYGNKMYIVTNAYYDNAHNEILQYLITIGALGLICYLGIVITSLKKCVRWKDKVLAAVVITYVFQSLVNINQVITTPMFFIILAMCNNEKIPTNSPNGDVW